MVRRSIGDEGLAKRTRGPVAAAVPGPSSGGHPVCPALTPTPRARHHHLPDPAGTGRGLPCSPAERHPPGRPGVREAEGGPGILGDFHWPAVINLGRANPAADRGWAMPTRMPAACSAGWCRGRGRRPAWTRHHRIFGADGQQGFDSGRGQVQHRALVLLLLVSPRLRNPNAAVAPPTPAPHPPCAAASETRSSPSRKTEARV